MTTPRTVAGQAAISGMRPHVKRALAQAILSIEAEAIAPYRAALREADRVLETLAGLDPASPWDPATRLDLVTRARATRPSVERLLVEDGLTIGL